MSSPRLLRPERNQVRLIPSSLDQVLPPDHPARDLWAYLEQADLNDLYGDIKAVEGAPGRPPIDPRLLLALWMFATTEGVGSARELAELCERDLPYMWLCGGLSPNYHTLADFRSDREAVFRRLLERHVTALVAAGVVKLQTVAHDGVRVRGHAGSGSLRRRSQLEEIRDEVKEQLDALATELHDDTGASQRRKRAARQRSLEQRAKNVQAAIERTREIDDQRAKGGSHRSKKEQAERQKDAAEGKSRASSTDPDATKMKMADGGFRPAYNCQTSMDPKSGFILRVQTTRSGSDGSLLPSAVDAIEATYGVRPSEVLADGGFVQRDAITRLEAAGTKVYAPVDRPKTPGADRYARRPSDSDQVAAWRKRMATEDGRKKYTLRCRIEWAFARMRNWGMRQFPVRTLSRVNAAFLLYALTHNFTNHMRLLRAAV